MAAQTNEIWKLRFQVAKERAEPFSDALAEAFFPEAAATASGEIENTPDWFVEAYYEEEPARADMDALLGRLAESLGETPRDVTIELLPPTDWVRKSLEGLAPVRAGRFFVHGTHDRDKIPPAAIPLQIDAAQAFGTGHHATTQGCLLAIDELCKRRHPKSALDLGCGTGILAIALAKRTRSTVLASDIDPLSVSATLDNARQNGVRPLIKTILARGMDHPALTAAAPYDLIVANILARPLASLSPILTASLTVDGHLILSGILRSQQNQVLSAYRQQGLFLQKTWPIKEWVTLLLAAR